jgi:hypothetical protein
MDLAGLKDKAQKTDFEYSLIILLVLVFWSSTYIRIDYV